MYTPNIIGPALPDIATASITGPISDISLHLYEQDKAINAIRANMEMQTTLFQQLLTQLLTPQ